MKGFWKIPVFAVIALAVLFGAFFLYFFQYKTPGPDQAPPTQTLSKFVIYGDTRTNHEIHQQIINDISQDSYQAAFHIGDLVNDGSSQDDWDNFFKIEKKFIASTNFYPVLGNHEKDGFQYFQYFDLPNNERWYSVDYPPIHFVVLDSNSDLTPNSEQILWLLDDLKKTKKNISHIVVAMHHPMHSSGNHGGDEFGFNKILEPIFIKYGVDVVFAGHDHDYERSYKSEIYYIVTGGGGAPLYDKKSPNPYSQKFLKKYNYCILESTGGALSATVYDIDKEVIDSFEIN